MKAKHLLQCHLLVSGVLPDLAAGTRLPGLEGLLAFAECGDFFKEGIEAWLCSRFDVQKQHDWPAAPFSALGEGLAPEDDYWLRVDPVHLHLLRDSLSLADCKPFGLTIYEAQSLLDVLNRHFSQDGLQFMAPAPDRWYARLSQPTALMTHPLSEAVGRNVDALLPQGGDAMLWHGWINEAQMLLHDHPVNLEREQRGQWPVNSIWPWGGGVARSMGDSPFTDVWTEDVLAVGLAKAVGANIGSIPPDVDQWLGRQSDGTHLMVLDSLDRPELRQSKNNWHEAMQKLDRQWFQPLLQALKTGSVKKVHVHLADFGSVRSFTVESGRFWKFWRRPKHLETYLHG